jgi:uncharacterized protein (TIGR03435 family)
MGNRLKSVVWEIAILASAVTVLSCQQLHGQSTTEIAPNGVKYEVVSIKPSPEETQRFNAHFTPTGFSARNITPLMIMRLAFGLFNSNDDLFSGVPAWAQSERFDVEAKVAEADTEKYGKLSPSERLGVLQAMLANTFHLEAIRGVREGKVYLLLPAKGGAKVKASNDGQPPSPAELSRGHIAGHDMLMKSLVSLLTQKFGTTVIDKTGLTGKYDITLNWDPTADQASTTGDGTTLQAALKEQLGLRLEAGTGPVEILTVQRMERPAEN